MGHDGENVRFALIAGQDARCRGFLASALDAGGVPQSRSKAFSRATIFTRSNVVMSFEGFHWSADGPYDLRSP